MAAASPSRAPGAGSPHAEPGGPPLWAVILAGVALTGLFIVLGFPYDRLATRVERSLERATGRDVEIGGLGPGLGLAGPRLVARDVRIALPDGSPLVLERAWGRPAWSLAWLRLRPALRIGASSAAGSLDGTLVLGGEPRFSGRLRGVDLSALPLDAGGSGLALEGTVDADVDLVRGERALVGTVHLDGRDGVAALPGLPVAVPYATLTGDLRFDDNGAVTIESLALDGPMLALELSGTVGPAPAWPRAPLRLAGRLEARDASLRTLLAGEGIALGPGGTREVRISGTLAAPAIR